MTKDSECGSSGSGGEAERSGGSTLKRPQLNLSELYKVLFFGLLYTIHAWRSYHEAICDEGAALLDSDSPTLTSSPSTAARSDSPAPADQASPQLRPATASPGCWYGSDYPCPPASAWLRLCFHALRPGVLYFVPFFRPPNPADLHDGLSMAFFMVGAVLCLWLGPPTSEGRRSSNLVLCWLVLLVVVPKGWLMSYGWAHPGASLGRAVERVLPSHAAMALWLSLAFPLTWRRQLLLSAVYTCAITALTAMAAARGWPYGSEVSPAAIVARSAAAGSAAVVLSYWAERRRNRHHRRLAQAQAQGEGEGQRATAGTAAKEQPETAAPPTPGVLEQSAASGSEAQPQPLHALHASQPTEVHDKAAAVAPPFMPSDPSSSPPAAASTSATPAPAPPQPHQLPPLPTDLPALLPALPLPLRRRPRYRSKVQGTCVRIKVPGLHARDLPPEAPLLLAEHLAGSGLMLAGMAVREGCMEVVLDIERVTPLAREAAAAQLPPGHQAAAAGVRGSATKVQPQQAASSAGRMWGLGGRRAGSNTGSGLVIPPSIIRSLVSTLVSAVLPRSAQPPAGPPALAAPATKAAPPPPPPPPVSASPRAEGRWARASGPTGVAAREVPLAGEAAGEVPLPGGLPAVAARRRLGSPVPVQVDVDGVRYLLAPDRTAVYDTPSDTGEYDNDCYGGDLSGSGGSLGSFDGDSWRMWVDTEYPEASRLGEGKAEGDCSLGKGFVVGDVGGAAGVFPPHGSFIALQPPVMVLPTACQQQAEGAEARRGGKEGTSSNVGSQAGPRGGVRLTLLLGAGGVAGDAGPRRQEQGGLRHVPLALEQLVAWQQGCFVRVLAVEEAVDQNAEGTAEPAARAREEGTASGAASGGGLAVPSPCSVRRFHVYLEPRDLSYGLLTFGVHQRRGHAAAQPPAPAPAPAPAASPASGSPTPELGPLCAVARVLLLPPGLAPLAHELSAPLVEDLDAALQLEDPDFACSVHEFLTDLSKWLAHGTALLDPPRVASPGEGTTQDQQRQRQQEQAHPPASMVVSGRVGSGGWLVDSETSSADSARSTLAGMYGSSTPATNATTTTTTAATTGPCSAEGASPGGRSLRASNSSLVHAAHTLAQHHDATAASTAAHHAQAGGGIHVDSRPHGEELSTLVILPGGRLDFRAGPLGIGWNGRMDKGQQQLQQEHEQQQGGVAATSGPTDPPAAGLLPLGTQPACHKGLLEYAVQCGWPYTVRLLLGLESRGEGGHAHAAGGGARGLELAAVAAGRAGLVGADESGAAVAAAVEAGVGPGRLGEVHVGEGGAGGGGRPDSWCAEDTRRAALERTRAEQMLQKREQQQRQQQPAADALRAPLSATTAAKGRPGGRYTHEHDTAPGTALAAARSFTDVPVAISPHPTVPPGAPRPHSVPPGTPHGLSLLHMAVASGCTQVVDAVADAVQYGTWGTQAAFPVPACGGAATPRVELLTPLHVAAALPDGGAMLAHVLTWHMDARAVCHVVPRGSSVSAQQVAAQAGNGAAVWRRAVGRSRSGPL